MKIAVLGAGKMGTSFSRSFLKFELVKPENLLLITRNKEGKPEVEKEFPNCKVLAFSEVEECGADLIILAVKPQDFAATAENLPFKIPEESVLLSVMAGISIENIQQACNHSFVVRAMPNTPTILGRGITGYTAAKGIPLEKIMQVERLLNSTGRSVYLEGESLLNGVTALSGSGPAYFYYIVSAMVQAGISMGIDEHLAKLFVKETMLGAYHLINNSEKSLDELIKDVASKGGTTEAALRTFEEGGLKEILQKGIIAAKERAQELSR